MLRVRNLHAGIRWLLLRLYCPIRPLLGVTAVRVDPSSDTSCPVYLVLALAHASPSVFVIRLMYIDVQPLAP